MPWCLLGQTPGRTAPGAPSSWAGKDMETRWLAGSFYRTTLISTALQTGTAGQAPGGRCRALPNLKA